MAIVSTDYILIPKKTGDVSSEIIKLTRDYFSKNGYLFNDGYYESNSGIGITMQTIHDKSSNRFHLTLSTEKKTNEAVMILKKLDGCIVKSDYNKLVSVIRAYDGPSEYLCKKLYPSFASFERKIRKLVLLVLTNTFGDEFIKSTITEQQSKDLMAKTRGGNLRIVDFFELFELNQLEEYLFGDIPIDYKSFISNSLSQEAILHLSKDDLVDLIESIRPCSLWEKLFSDIGDEFAWKENIDSIRKYRNVVAHNKFISFEDYIAAQKLLSKTNKDIDKAIHKILNTDFSKENEFYIADKLSKMMKEFSNSVLAMYDFSPIFKMTEELLSRIKPIINEDIIDNMSYITLELSEKLQKIRSAYDFSNKNYNADEKSINSLSDINEPFHLEIEELNDDNLDVGKSNNENEDSIDNDIED